MIQLILYILNGYLSQILIVLGSAGQCFKAIQNFCVSPSSSFRPPLYPFSPYAFLVPFLLYIILPHRAEEVVEYSYKYTKPDVPVFGPSGT